MREFFLARLTSGVPSWVTLISSQASLAVVHAEILMNSSLFREEWMMFSAFASFSALLISFWSQSSNGFSISFPLIILVGTL
ncbi:hypothetical protein Fmac_017771 [Flemingia macrophylla]|uniref:Uncharacterized protein n=1 Tax=Flemingia macrophylla TaxID=520843 RepID=A0ABD1M337_9FABA